MDGHFCSFPLSQAEFSIGLRAALHLWKCRAGGPPALHFPPELHFLLRSGAARQFILTTV